MADMSTITTAQSRGVSTGTPAPEKANAPLRLWPAVVLVIAFWTFLYVNYTFEMSQGPRFFSRMIAYAIAILAFFGWWLSRSKVSWRDRLLAVAVVIGYGVATCLITDKSMNAFALALSAFPLIVTVWTGWLLVSRRLTAQTRRVGFCLLMLPIFAFFTLVRFDGLWAGQQAEMHWRWTPTHEQDFLAAHSVNGGNAENSAAEAKTWTVQPGDCPEFRGPQRDGVVTGVSVIADWSEHPPKQLWRKKVGPGWSGMIVVDGHAVTQEQRDKVESVVCYDAATGNEVWAHDNPVRFEEPLAGAGPRGTPTFVNGRIYALGGLGTLNCLKPETGEVIWSHDVVKDSGLPTNELPQWGYAVSPLVIDNLVIVFAGGTTGKGVLAYHADDGKLAWAVPSGKTSYSSPQVATLGGQKRIVMHDTGALRVLNVADGKEVWSYPNGGEMSLPMLQPHVVGPTDLVVSITPGMGRFEVSSQVPTDGEHAPRWSTNKLRPDFSDFVIHKDSIFGLNDGILVCLDLETGDQVWKKSRLGHGQVVMLADQDALLVSNEKGEIILVAVDRQGPTELGRFQAIDGKTWNGPVLVGNRVFLRNAAEMAAYEINVQSSKPQSPASALPTNSL
jgi:outer membrane protein assembly factor BamB